MKKSRLIWNVAKEKCHAELGSASSKKLQYGRSMIEMIGVLAIIGVISIGGVWGINKAMTKNTANNIIEDVKLAGFIVVSELFDTLPDVDEESGLNLAGKFAQNTPYTFKAFPEGETTFEIFVPDVSYNVCMELKQRKVDWLEELMANGKENVCKKDVMNEMSFFFNTELAEEPEMDDNTCRSDRDCPAAKPYCRSGYCTKCEEGLELKDGSCVDCQLTGKSTQITRAGCASCPNRCWDSSKNACYLSSEGNAFISNDGTCNYNCPQGMLIRQDTSKTDKYTCTDCPPPTKPGGNPWVAWTSAEHCHDCGNHFMSISAYKACSSCDTDALGIPSISTKAECDLCDSRCWDEEKQRCWLVKKGNVFNNNGICNYQCPTGQLVKWSYAGGGMFECTNCPTSKSYVAYTSAEYCHACSNTLQASHYCADCRATGEYAKNTSHEECKRCTNRYFDETAQKCYLCPSGKKASEDGLSCVDE